MKNTLTILALGLSLLFSASTNAQDEGQQTRQLQVQRQQQRVLPQVSPQLPQPKLGLWGHMDYRGMVVDSVVPNSPASKLGLEPGDVITRINGRRIDSIYKYQTLLRDAVAYNHGRISARIENIRWHTGQSFEKYVTATTYLTVPQYGFGGSQPADAHNHGSQQGGSFGG